MKTIARVCRSVAGSFKMVALYGYAAIWMHPEDDERESNA